MSFSNQDSQGTPDVEILSPSSKMIFTCSDCGCQFSVSKKYVKREQTGMNEFSSVFNCPECGHKCYNWGKWR